MLPGTELYGNSGWSESPFARAHCDAGAQRGGVIEVVDDTRHVPRELQTRTTRAARQAEGLQLRQVRTGEIPLGCTPGEKPRILRVEVRL